MNKIKTFFILSEEDRKQCSRKYFNITPDICICENFIVTLKSDGTVFVSGDKQFDIQEWINVIKICSGKNHVVGLKSDGTVVALGDNTYHQCDVSAWRDIVCISAKDNLTVGISSENITYTTGLLKKNDSQNTIYEAFRKRNIESSITNIQRKVDNLEKMIKQNEQGRIYYSGNFEYFINNNTATLIKYLSSDSLEHRVWIPRKINGKLVRKISKEIFSKCEYLEEINVDENNQYYSSNDGVLFDKNQTELIFYPIGKSNIDYTIPDEVVVIKDDAFGDNLYKNKNLKYLNISSNVEYIGKGNKGFANNVSV